MASIIFVTGNERKVGEAKLACAKFGIDIIPKAIHIDEIQSSTAEDISADKAKKAFDVLKNPLVVTDTYWQIPSLGGFPGAYAKDIVDWFTSEDFLSLLKDKDDRTISFSENVTYIDKKGIKMISKTFVGQVVESPRGTGNSLENVAEFEGFTLGERRQQGGFSHKPEDYVWFDFAKWFSEYNK